MPRRGVNRVILIGNLGQAPEIRNMPNGKAVANFTVATSEAWKDKQTGEQKEVTEWHKVCCYDRLAEICGQYLNKGSKIYVEGRLQTRKWQDQQNQDRYTTEIIAHEMQMLDGRPQNGQQAQPAASHGAHRHAPSQPPQAPAPSASAPGQAPQQQASMPGYPQGSPGDFDDSMPF